MVAKTGTSRLFLTHEDTVVDLALPTGGGIVGALIVAFFVTSRRSERPEPRTRKSSAQGS